MIELFDWFDALPDRYFVYALLFILGFALGSMVLHLKIDKEKKS